LEKPLITHFEKCLLIRRQTLELLADVAEHRMTTPIEQFGHKVTLLYDELEYAWQQACFNELLIVYEKAKHLSRLVVSEQRIPGNNLKISWGHSSALLA
jgi:hypothetical protein